MKSKVNDEDWWSTVSTILTVITPIVELLRLGDSEVPLMGKVYARMAHIQGKLEDAEFAPELTPEQRRAIVRIHEDRWAYLHNFYHAAGYALDPEFVGEGQHSNATIMTGFRAVCDRLHYKDPSKATKAKMQLTAFQDKARGVFKEAGVWKDAKEMPAHEWWAMYGAELPELQYVALRVLSKRSSACSVERLWSLFGSVWSDARARLGPMKAINLVKAGANIRLKRKLETMDYESQMRSWLVDPEDSDDDGDNDADSDGAVDDAAPAEGHA